MNLDILGATPIPLESTKIILEPFMEKVFHPRSYGFSRPGRSVYDALREVSRMTGIS